MKQSSHMFPTINPIVNFPETVRHCCIRNSEEFIQQKKIRIALQIKGYADANYQRQHRKNRIWNPPSDTSGIFRQLEQMRDKKTLVSTENCGFYASWFIISKLMTIHKTGKSSLILGNSSYKWVSIGCEIYRNSRVYLNKYSI